jgi:hypothetical protein
VEANFISCHPMLPCSSAILAIMLDKELDLCFNEAMLNYKVDIHVFPLDLPTFDKPNKLIQQPWLFSHAFALHTEGTMALNWFAFKAPMTNGALSRLLHSSMIPLNGIIFCLHIVASLVC